MGNSLSLSGTDLSLVPGTNIDSYINYVFSLPILEEDEEKILAKQYIEKNILSAAHKLIASHLRVVVIIARKYSGYGLPLNDLIQEGNIGLMKAVKHFDPERGARLVSFATHWIKAEIVEFVVKNWRIVKMATTKQQRKLFFNLRKLKEHIGWLSQDDTKAIAQTLNVDEKTVTEMESRMWGRDVTFESPDQSDSDHVVAPIDFLVDEGADPYENIADENESHVQAKTLKRALNELDGRSKDIVMQRWMNPSETVTLKDLSEKYGVSIERIRQIESNAMKKMRTMFVA